jgi:hypothetical protein
MKNDYLISYYDCMPSFFDEVGDYHDVSDSAGWYVQISDNPPWGPFSNQKEAIESLLIEWPRFENGYWDTDETKPAEKKEEFN